MNEEKRYYTEEEFCKLIGISRKTAFQWRRKKLISFMRTPTGIIRYRQSDIEAYERRSSVKAKGERAA